VIIEPRTRSIGSFTVNRLLPWRQRRMVGPFVFLDVMGPADFAPGSGMDVDAHPHIGLSTLTYLLRGRARHRDSMGVVQDIEAGAVNWMTAGRGVCHTERSIPEDRVVGSEIHGLQFWVALPEGAEDGEPRFEHADAADAPDIEIGRSRMRLLAGTGWGASSSVPGSSPLVLADVTLAGQDVPVGDDHEEIAVLALDGVPTVAGSTLGVGLLHVLEPGDRPVVGGTGRVIVIGGEPLGRRHIWWNFVHSDQAVIDDAKQRWTRQEFPLVPADHDPYVPLPSS
jgi:hypothetical protein